jgi:hypothetical protein
VGAGAASDLRRWARDGALLGAGVIFHPRVTCGARNMFFLLFFLPPIRRVELIFGVRLCKNYDDLCELCCLHSMC